MRSNVKVKAKPVLVVLATALAMSVVGVSSASATLPEFTPPENKFTGQTGRWKISVPGSGFFECSTAKLSGEISSKTGLSKVFVKNWTCLGVPFCPTEEPESNELKGRIGYLSAPKKEVGLLLEAVGHPWWNKCGHLSHAILGSVIGKITPVNVKTTKFTIKYEIALEVQRLKKFEGEEAVHTLELLYEGTGTKEPFGLETSGELTTERPLEIKA